jgi:serine/threonine-protein kinase
MPLDEARDGSALIGKMAGRYLIVSELATDGRRTLYEAENVELGVRVTLGVVRADGTPTAQRLVNGEKLRSLKQPGLVTVLDVGKLDGGDLYLATERAIGTPLRTLITGKLLEQPRALAIMRQVLGALAAAHEAGAIHGDIKPENIFVASVDREERVKLADFGVATLAGLAKPGDPRYSAPESALGAIDARADLYAVGAVLFELLTGHPPFFADDANALRRLHAYAPRQTLKQRAPDLVFNHALEELVAMALERKRDARFQSARDMIAVLDHAVQSIAELASPAPDAARRRKPNDSLLLLAKDLMAPSASEASTDVAIPVNVGRHVPELPWPTRAIRWLRKAGDRLADRIRPILDRLTRTQKRILGSVGAALVVAIVVLVVTSGGESQRTHANVAERATSLIRDGKANEALPLLKREVAAHPDNGAAHALLGDAQLALGHEREALAAYASAVLAVPALAGQRSLLASVSRIAASRDPETAIAALDLIALRFGTQGHDVLATHASSDERAEVRHRAFLLAQRTGSIARTDRVASWILDLDQASSCEQRRAAIRKLASTSDQRSLPALRSARTHKCVERDATAAIQRITAASKKRGP